jgi:hypothetical protein
MAIPDKHTIDALMCCENRVLLFLLNQPPQL